MNLNKIKKPNFNIGKYTNALSWFLNNKMELAPNIFLYSKENEKYTSNEDSNTILHKWFSPKNFSISKITPRDFLLIKSSPPSLVALKNKKGKTVLDIISGEIKYKSSDEKYLLNFLIACIKSKLSQIQDSIIFKQNIIKNASELVLHSIVNLPIKILKLLFSENIIPDEIFNYNDINKNIFLHILYNNVRWIDGDNKMHFIVNTFLKFQRFESFNVQNNEGNTLLMILLHNENYFDICEELIKNMSTESIIAQNDHGKTALMIIVEELPRKNLRKAYRICNILLSKMSSEAIAAQDIYGNTALMLAYKNEYIPRDFQSILLDSTSVQAINLRNRKNKNALNLALDLLLSICVDIARGIKYEDEYKSESHYLYDTGLIKLYIQDILKKTNIETSLPLKESFKSLFSYTEYFGFSEFYRKNKTQDFLSCFNDIFKELYLKLLENIEISIANKNTNWIDAFNFAKNFENKNKYFYTIITQCIITKYAYYNIPEYRFNKCDLSMSVKTLGEIMTKKFPLIDNQDLLQEIAQYTGDTILNLPAAMDAINKCRRTKNLPCLELNLVDYIEFIINEITYPKQIDGSFV